MYKNFFVLLYADRIIFAGEFFGGVLCTYIIYVYIYIYIYIYTRGAGASARCSRAAATPKALGRCQVVEMCTRMKIYGFILTEISARCDKPYLLRAPQSYYKFD